MAMTDRDSRFKWSETKEQELWSFMESRMKSGASVTGALKEYGRSKGMSWLTARWKYYQLRKRAAREMAEPVAHSGAQARDLPGAKRVEDDLLTCLSDFVSLSSEAGEDVTSLIRGLARLAMMSNQGQKLKEAASLEVAETRAALKGAGEALSRLTRFLEDWLRQAQVDRVRTLKAFSTRLRQELDEIKAGVAGASG